MVARKIVNAPSRNTGLHPADPSVNVGMKVFQDDDINYRINFAKKDEKG